MKRGATAVGVLGLIFACSVLPVAHADQMGDLCSILNTSRNNGAALTRQIANERNPLKQNSLQQQLQQINQQREASLNSFLKVNRRQFVNFTGVVSSFSAMRYNSGPGVMLEIRLPCQLSISFQFIEITNPAWGNFLPESQTPLSKWRRALENIVVGDSVTFSGRFVLDKGLSFAVMTELRKKGGIAYKVEDAYMPTGGTFEKPTVSQGGLTWMPITFANNWRKASAYCSELNGNGQTGWRMPTQPELDSLFNSGAMSGQGWALGHAWSSTPATQTGPGWYWKVGQRGGQVTTYSEDVGNSFTNVSCVRASSSAPPATDAGQGQQPVPTAPTATITINGQSSMTDIDPLLPRTWEWSSANGSTYAITATISGCEVTSQNGTLYNWPAWLREQGGAGTAAMGSNTQTPGRIKYGCTIATTYSVSNSAGPTATANATISFKHTQQ